MCNLYNSSDYMFVDQQVRKLHIYDVYIFVVSVVSLLRWNM